MGKKATAISIGIDSHIFTFMGILFSLARKITKFENPIKFSKHFRFREIISARSSPSYNFDIAG